MENQTTNQMTAVVTFSSEVQAKIDELKEQNYHDEDMFDFINEHGSDNFIAYYEEYVEQGEDYSYEVVDAFVDEFGIECIAHFTDAYYGEYDSEEQFAEQFVNDCYPNSLQDMPVVIDWSATWNCNLRYDLSFVDGYIFHKNF